MAGPALRNWAFARAISRECNVTLLTPNADFPQGDGFDVQCHKNSEGLIKDSLTNHDVLLFQGYMLASFPGLTTMVAVVTSTTRSHSKLWHINSHHGMAERVRLNGSDLGVLLQQLRVGDFFVWAAYDWQLDLVRNASACNRPTSQNSDQDPAFESCSPLSHRGSCQRHLSTPARSSRASISNPSPVDIGGSLLDW